MRSIFDVDIDVAPDTDKKLFGTPAMVYNEKTERIAPHPSGVYLEPVPIDKVTGLCAFDYEYGNEHGFMKVDVLNNSVYTEFESKEEVRECLEKEPDWNDFLDEKLVSKLPHIGKHYELVLELKPKSIEDLADILALIRPGKIEFLDEYMEDKIRVRKKLYKRSSGMYFKKSHAVSYACMIVALLNKRTKNRVVW